MAEVLNITFSVELIFFVNTSFPSDANSNRLNSSNDVLTNKTSENGLGNINTFFSGLEDISFVFVIILKFPTYVTPAKSAFVSKV